MESRSCESVSVTWWGTGLPSRGAAEASRIGADWWVSRVVVHPAMNRGKGIGGRMLEALKKMVAAEGGTSLLVQPGGYAMNTADQDRFYEAHGFVKTNAEEGLFVCDLTDQ